MSKQQVVDIATKAVIYARVSTDKAEQATSIPNQCQTCRQYCMTQGWEIVDEISDTASGSSFERPGWKKLMDLVQSGKAGRIVITARDRISRDAIEYGLLKRDILKHLGVSINPVTGVVAQTDGCDGLADPNVELAEGMEMIFAQHQRSLIKWKTVQGMRRSAEQGIFISKPPFGTVAGPEKGVPVKAPDTWPVLERIFELSAAGHTTAEICSQLNEAGVPSHKGARWDHSAVRHILQNPFYLGERIIMGQPYQLKHQCRIDTDLWERAQKPKASPQRGGRKPSHYVNLIPRVVCSAYRTTHPVAKAGHPLLLTPKYTLGRGGAMNYYYYRSDRLRKHGGVKSEPLAADFLRTGIRAEDLDRAVVMELIQLCSESTSEHFVRGSVSAALQQAAVLENEQVSLLKQKSKLERQERANQKKLVSAFDGKHEQVVKALEIELTECGVKLAAMTQRLKDIESALTELNCVRMQLDENVGKISLVEKLWKDNDRHGLRRLLHAIVKEVDIREEGAYLVLKPVRALEHILFATREKAALSGGIVEPVSWGTGAA